MRTRDGDWLAYRHIFTSAPDNFLGGGFKTVASSAALHEMTPFIESLVESYKNLEGGGARCRQFVPLPQGKAYALTEFIPLDDSPDGRTGNFWAETQIVPSDWLEQAGWDAAAAFDALSWWGFRSPGDLPLDLEPKPLPDVKPRALARLARLNELVPPHCLEPLLLAVVQQSHGLRSLELLEAQGSPASDLEEVVMLLPLTVPPTSRRYRDGDQLRCLTLRTRCPVGGMTPRTDITGYPTAAADGLELSDGFVVDLAGRVPTKLPEDRFGRDYAKWLHGVIEKRQWVQLEDLYERADPGVSFFGTYRALLQAPSRSRVAISAEAAEPAAVAPERAPDSEEPSGNIESLQVAVAPPAAVPEVPAIPPIQEWKQEALARDVLEGELWKVRESHRGRIEELVGKIGKDFAADLDKARSRLLDDIAASQQKSLQALEAHLKEIEKKEVEKKIKKPTKGSQQNAAPRREASSVEARLDELERDFSEIKERLAAGEGMGGAGTTVVEGRVRRFFRESLGPSRDWLYDHRWTAWGAGIAIVTLVLLAFALDLRAPEVTPDLVAPTELQARKASTQALLKRAQQGKIAALLLESAALQDDITQRAHNLTVVIVLNHGIQITDEMSCALVQAALRVEGLVVPVMGTCGPQTITALVAAPKAECCQTFQAAVPPDVKKLQNCFLTDYLQLGLQNPGQQVEACGGESPWQKRRAWTEEESLHALALFQRAASSFAGERGSDLDKALRDLDPAQGPGLLQRLAGETLTKAEAKRVLELIWAAWSGQQQKEEARLGKLSARQLDDLGRIVDEVVNARGAR